MSQDATCSCGCATASRPVATCTRLWRQSAMTWPGPRGTLRSPSLVELLTFFGGGRSAATVKARACQQMAAERAAAALPGDSATLARHALIASRFSRWTSATCAQPRLTLRLRGALLPCAQTESLIVSCARWALSSSMQGGWRATSVPLVHLQITGELPAVRSALQTLIRPLGVISALAYQGILGKTAMCIARRIPA